ncbi:MAG: alpha glucosidase [Rhizobiales bacterium]|nr:alpha glucosidase [Hyphomicrobiales bacterium]
MREWWRGACIYQIYPRSYQDDNGDGIGDLKGITRRLDHVASLGVDGIWLSPIFQSPMQDMGYDVSDHTAVDPLFGTLDDCRALLDKAHSLGLKVIFDQVLSHTASRHPWFVESRSSRDNARADWFVWADPKPDGSPPNNWQSLFGGSAWEWEARRGQYYFHNFLTSQPDLNFHCEAVQDAVLETVDFWLKAGVDGFRLDTVNYYFHDRQLRDDPPEPSQAGKYWVKPYDAQDHIHSKSQPENLAFLKKLRALVDRYPDRMLVGEVGDEHHSIDTMAAYTEGGDKLHMAYSFDMLGPKFSAGHFRDCIATFFARAADGWPSWSFSNHDVERHVTRWAASSAEPDALSKQSAALLLSFEGSVGIYQGEELGLPETVLDFAELTDPPGIRMWPEYKGRDGCRTPMPWDSSQHAGFTTATPWLPVKELQKSRNVLAQEAESGSVLAFYRAMIALRQSSPALRLGGTIFLATPEPVLAFVRTCKGEDGRRDCLCVFNLSQYPVSMDIKGLAKTVAISAGIARPSARSVIMAANGFLISHLVEAGNVEAPVVTITESP